MKTVVANKYHVVKPQPNDVNIMRPGPWGNDFVIGRDGTRDEVIAKHKAKYEHDEEFKARVRTELAGKRLICCCHPKACHGDWLAEIANETTVKVE